MPFYEFKCSKCEKIQTLLLSVADRNQTQVCSDCTQNLVRVITPGLIKIKGPFGSGFTKAGKP